MKRLLPYYILKLKNCTYQFLIVFVIIMIFQACAEQRQKISENFGMADKFSCSIVYHGDTINRTYNGIKQGHFVLFENDIQRNTPYTKSPPEAVYTEVNKQKSLTSPGKPLEEGDYKDDKKQGKWVYYNSDGTIKAEIEFKDGIPVAK